MAQQNDTIKTGLNALFGGAATPKEEVSDEAQERVVLHGHGRPRKDESCNTTGNDMRTSLIVNKATYDKMRIIAIQEGLTLKEVLDSAFRLAIERYEAKRGKITSEPVRAAKEDLFK